MVRRRTFWIVTGLLAVSLLANVFFVGMATGRLGLLGAPGELISEAHGARAGLRAALPRELRRHLRAEFGEDMPVFLEEMRVWRTAREEALRAMRAEPFDEAALEARLADVRAGGLAVYERFHETLLRTLANAPPELRRKIEAPE